MTLDDILNNKVFLSLCGVVFTLTIAFIKLQKSNLDKKIDGAYKKKAEHDEEIRRLQIDINKLEKRLLEYQVAASSTFVLKEDLHEFKRDIRSMYENSSG